MFRPIAFVLTSASCALAARDDPASTIPEPARGEIVAACRSTLEVTAGKYTVAEKVALTKDLLKSAEMGRIDKKLKATIQPKKPGVDPFVFPFDSAREAKIRDLKREADRWADPLGEPTYFFKDLGGFKAGAFGCVRSRPKVLKVIDKTTLIIEWVIPAPAPARPERFPVIVYGVDTSEMVDGRACVLPHIYYAAGPRQVGDTRMHSLVAFIPSKEESNEVLAEKKQ